MCSRCKFVLWPLELLLLRLKLRNTALVLTHRLAVRGPESFCAKTSCEQGLRRRTHCFARASFAFLSCLLHRPHYRRRPCPSGPCLPDLCCLTPTPLLVFLALAAPPAAHTSVTSRFAVFWAPAAQKPAHSHSLELPLQVRACEPVRAAVLHGVEASDNLSFAF